MLFARMATQTAFRRWREQMGFTQDEAAEALGVTRSQVANWDAGKVRGRKRGGPSTPPLSVRRVMTALDIGQLPEPWPE